VTVLEEEVLVSAPPGRVWEVVSDPRNLPQWDRRIAGVTGVPDGGLTNGSTYTTEMRFLGARATVHARVLEIEPPRYSKVRLTGLVDAVIETWVEPDGDSRSRLRHRIEYRFRGGPLGDLAARAVRMFGARSLLRRGEQAQKRQAESSG